MKNKRKRCNICIASRKKTFFRGLRNVYRVQFRHHGSSKASTPAPQNHREIQNIFLCTLFLPIQPFGRIKEF